MSVRREMSEEDIEGEVFAERVIEESTTPKREPDTPPQPGQKAARLCTGAEPLRSYQSEILEECRARGNTIVVLPTGAGKTHIAARLIADHAEREPAKVAVFLATTVPLASQQYEFLMNRTRLRAALLTGDVCSGGLVSGVLWKKVRRYSVVVMTPQIFATYIKDDLTILSDVSVIVFDECHNARGDGCSRRGAGAEGARLHPRHGAERCADARAGSGSPGVAARCDVQL
jgi:superfamily II DNA or RNA helicase